MSGRPRPGLETTAVHAGEAREGGAVVTPIYQTAMFLTEEDVPYHDIRYLRLSNSPNHRVLAEKLAALERAEAAVVAASGMAAISAALLAVLGAGEHLLAHAPCTAGLTTSSQPTSPPSASPSTSSTRTTRTPGQRAFARRRGRFTSRR